jgi:hypothetical protein
VPDLGPLLPALAIALLAVVLLWFALGTQANVRRGNRIMAWLQGGLPLLGPRANLHWFGSSVAKLTILDPIPPFREADVLVVLEPRDLGAIWAVSRRRGRRDLLIVRARLTRAPRFAVEMVAPGSWTMPGGGEPDPLLARRDGLGADAGYDQRDDGLAPVDELRRWWGVLDEASAGVWRISVHSVVPHLEVHVLPPDPGRMGSEPLIAAVRDLAELASSSTRARDAGG